MSVVYLKKMKSGIVTLSAQWAFDRNEFLVLHEHCKACWWDGPESLSGGDVMTKEDYHRKLLQISNAKCTLSLTIYPEVICISFSGCFQVEFSLCYDTVHLNQQKLFHVIFLAVCSFNWIKYSMANEDGAVKLIKILNPYRDAFWKPGWTSISFRMHFHRPPPRGRNGNSKRDKFNYEVNL